MKLIFLTGSFFAATIVAAHAAEWSMLVEVNGMTNRVEAGDTRYAIDVSFAECEGARSGKIVNREKGAVVLGFEVMSDPMAVIEGKSTLYVPHVYGRRIRNWPEHGKTQPGTPMWTETKKGVFVPFMSKWDVATGSRPSPLPFPSKIATMQWMTLNEGEKGFYVASEDPLAGAKDLQVEYDSNTRRIKLGFFFPLHLTQGHTYDIPRVVMKEYAGSWHKAAKMYRTWWNTCRKVVSIPKSVRETFTGFFMVILKQQNRDIVWPYTDFESLGDAALAHGFRHVEFHGWGVGGHDNFYPEYDPDPAMGGRDTLMKGIKRLQDKGLHVSVYSNGQLQQQGGTKWYEEKGYKCAIVKRDGKTMSEYWVKFKDYPGVTFDVACPSSPEWREQMLKICQDAKALGFQGFFYDQIGKQWPGACFDSRHGHRPGEFVYTHDRETMLLNVVNTMHKDDPDFVLWSESFNDTILNSVALYQGLFYVTDGGYNVANRFVDGNACDMYPEMTFYTFPELIMCDRNSTSLCTRKRANECAVTNLRVDFEVRYRADRDYVERGEEPPDGYYGKIVSKPTEAGLMRSETWRENRDYLKCVSDFRRTNSDLLLAGTFKADEGVKVSGGRKIIANRWDGEKGETGILVWNADESPASVMISFDGSLLSVSEPEKGAVESTDAIPANTLRLYRYLRLEAQNKARVKEIQSMLRPEAGFAETRIDNREFWDKIAQSGARATATLENARKIAVSEMPVPDDSRYMEYGEWTKPLQKCKRNLAMLALAECIENKGAFLPKIVEYLEMFSTRRCWTGRYHDRKCESFNGKIHIVELGNGQIAQDIAVVLDVLRNRLPSDVRNRAVAAIRRNCLDTYLGIAGDPAVAVANRCGWLKGQSNWNAACNEYMVSAALHVLDDSAERATAVELAERSTRFFTASYTEDGLCKEGASYWSYGFGQYMRLALWTRKATGTFLSFITPFSEKAFLSSYGSNYNDKKGPAFGDCNQESRDKQQHLGGLIWPQYDRIGAFHAGFLKVGLADFTLRHEEFRDPAAFLARKQKPFKYPIRSWYPSEIAQLVCRPAPENRCADSLYAAIQGGYNARPHGHHDIGSYCIAVGDDAVEVMGDPGNVKYDLDTFGPKRFENPMRNSFGHPVPRVDGYLQSGGMMSRAKVLSTSFSDDRDFVEYDMKEVYRDATNLVSLTRSLEYLRSENRVVVTDKVAFREAGMFETALTTLGGVQDIGGGLYRLVGMDGKTAALCKVSVKGATWHMEQEKLPENAGSQVAELAKAKPLRAAIVLDEPVREAEVKVAWHVVR